MYYDNALVRSKKETFLFYFESELCFAYLKELYKHIYNTYKGSTIWITGHSLGGALASLVGQTFGVPTVTFEIPGDRLASTRLHLPHAPGGRSPVWHFGHTADPIFVGVCTVSKKVSVNINHLLLFIGSCKQLLVWRLCDGIKMSHRKGK